MVFDADAPSVGIGMGRRHCKVRTDLRTMRASHFATVLRLWPGISPGPALHARLDPREPIIHSTLVYILLAATISGVGSIFGAALLSLTAASRVVERMVSFSVGVLLATALLHSLPE